MPGSGSSPSLSCDFSVRITYSLVEKPNFRTSWQNNKAEINFYQERILAAIQFIWWQLKLIFFNLKDVPKSWLPAYFTNSSLTDKKAYSAFPWLHSCNLKVNIIFTDEEVGVVITTPPPPTPLEVWEHVRVEKFKSSIASKSQEWRECFVFTSDFQVRNILTFSFNS